MNYLIFPLIFLLTSCLHTENKLQNKTTLDTLQLADIPSNSIDSRKYDSIILQLPKIDDTSELIYSLRHTYKFEVDESHDFHESISKCQLLTIGKDKREFVFVEYDYENGCSAAYPWKYQVVLPKKSTKPLLIGTYQSLDPIRLNNEMYLLAKSVSAKGHGSHQLLRLSKDTLINVLDFTNCIRTVDSHSDDGFFIKPLAISIIDFNRDGNEDLVFEGVRKMIMGVTENGNVYDLQESEYYSKPVKFIFIFNADKQNYVPFENYKKKYKELYL